MGRLLQQGHSGGKRWGTTGDHGKHGKFTRCNENVWIKGRSCLPDDTHAVDTKLRNKSFRDNRRVKWVRKQPFDTYPVVREDECFDVIDIRLHRL